MRGVVLCHTEPLAFDVVKARKSQKGASREKLGIG